MRALLLLAVLLSGCQTERAYVRARSRLNLSRCLSMASYALPFQVECLRESEAQCEAAGLERDCGRDL